MNEELITNPTPPAAEPKKRSCLGCAVKGGLGCAAFSIGVIAILALVGPKWIAGVILAGFRDEFNEEHEGRLLDFEYELSWNDTQYLRNIQLLDPDGEPVLTLDLELPSLVSMVGVFSSGSDTFELGRIVCEIEGEIVADESGQTNLERALKRTREPYTGGTRTVTVNGRDPDEAITQVLSRLEFVLDVKSAQLTYSDPQTRAAELEVGVRNLQLQARARPGSSWTVTGDADIVSETEGRLDLSLTARDPDWSDEAWPFGVVIGEIDLRGLSTTMVDGLLGQEGRLTEALGPLLDLDLNIKEGTLDGGSFELGLESDHQALNLIGHFEEDVFLMRGAEKLAWNLEVPRALIEPILAESLPDDLEVLLPDSTDRWTFEVAEFELPFTTEPDTRDLSASERLSEMLERASFTAHVGLSEVQIKQAGKSAIRVDEIGLSGIQTADGFKALVEFELATDSATEPAKIAAEAGPLRPWPQLFADEESRVPFSWSADVSVSNLPLRGLLSDMGIENEQFALLDGAFAGNVQFRDGLGETLRVGANLANDSVRVSLTDLWMDREFLVRTGENDLIVVELAGSKLTQLLAEQVPEGMSVSLPDQGCKVIVESAELARNESGSEAFELGQLAARARVVAPWIAVELDDSEQVSLARTQVALQLAPELNPVVELTSGVAGSEQAQIKANVVALHSLDEILKIADASELRFKLDASANALPSSLVDRLAEQDGLIVDVLGPELNLTCTSPAIGLERGPLKLHMNSEKATLDWAGTLEDGVMISSGEDQLEAKVGLSPLFNERIIGSLVPMLVNAQKDESAEPVLLTLSDCNLPLGGDLSKFNGKLRLDLGAVQYRVLPQLEEFLGKSARIKNSVVDPIDINIVNGVAHYENLAIEIGGKNYSFAGSIALATNTLSFETDIPLSNLGSRLDRNVRRLVDKGLLDANTAVPVTLGGTVKKPKVGLRDGFIQSLTKDLVPNALEDALKGGLDKLLGRD